MGYLETIKKQLVNLPGWFSGQKIVVFESDDWGSVRTSSQVALKQLEKAGLQVDRCHYMLNDSLASEEDLDKLFNVLSKHRSKSGSRPVITANVIMANPDFLKIKTGNYEKYHYEHFTETLKRYPAHDRSFEFWKKGALEGFFHPQLHGREHLHITRWMNDLRDNAPLTRKAADFGMFGISSHISLHQRGSYLAAFDLAESGIPYNREAVLEDALKSFQKTFNTAARSFIAPNYIWDKEVEEILAKGKIKYIQGTNVQRISKKNGDPNKIRRHYQGQCNKLGQRYLLRNAFFEPSSKPDKDWVNSCLKEIDTVFKWRKPAIICTHRVNFIGFLNPANREKNIKLFDYLLAEIIKNWPEVNFMSSDQLGDLMDKGDK